MSKVKKDQRNADKPKQKYRVTNWKAYNRALENRGNITFYFSEDLLAQWYSDLPNQRGAQQVYSDECIEAIMSFKTLFKLPYRQVRGFTEGLLSLLGEGGLRVPSFSQINRRFLAMDIAPVAIPTSAPVVIAIDSTGVKVYGEGEWKCRKHGYSKRRTWRKPHLGVDVATGLVHCHTTTENSAGDESQLEELLEQLDEQPAEVSTVCLDGAYDNYGNYESLPGRNITPVIPPRKNAVKWYGEREGDMDEHPRNVALDRIEELGRKGWKQEALYHRRSLSETAMFRFKTIFGATQFSRRFPNQQQENKLKIKLLNKMTALGMPRSEKVVTA